MYLIGFLLYLMGFFGGIVDFSTFLYFWILQFFYERYIVGVEKGERERFRYGPVDDK